MVPSARGTALTDRSVETPLSAKTGPCYTAPDMSDTPEGSTETQTLLGRRFLTVAEVARQLRVSNMTVYRLIKAGDLRAVRVGRGYRLLEDDVRKYLDRRYMDAG
jgi:excisionase family DNA binding protein